MAEEIVRVIKVEAGNSGRTINQLKREIRDLRKELDQTTIGSQEFQNTFRKLTNVQREYSQINTEINQRSKANLISIQQMTKLGSNLAKTYSSINAIIGLLGDGNEDLNKSMLKVQRTIQLIQGLSGIQGLVKQIPLLIKGFKDWFASFDPIEKKVTNITKGINGIDGKKLNQIAKIQGGKINIGDIGKQTKLESSGGTVPITKETQAIQEQTQAILALNQEKEKLIAEEGRLTQEQQTLTKQMDELTAKRNAEQQSVDNSIKRSNALRTVMAQEGSKMDVLRSKVNELSDAYKAAGMSTEGNVGFVKSAATGNYVKELAAKGKYQKEIKELESSIAAGQAKIEGFEKSIASSKAKIAEYDKQLAPIKQRLKEIGEQSEIAGKSVSKMGSIATKAGNLLKSAFNAAIFTGLVAVIIGVATWIWKLATNIKTAAKEQREFNKAIREGTAQGSAKAIVILKELAIAYQKVGDSAKAKEQFLVDYNDKIKETGIAVNDVNTADDVFIKNTSKYITALMQRAKAQATENYAIKKYEEYLVEREKLEDKAANPKLNFLQNWAATSFINDDNQTIQSIENYEKATEQFLEDNKKKSEKAISDLDKDMEAKLNKWFTDIATLQASYAGIFGSGDSGGGGGNNEDKTPKENPYAFEEEMYKAYLSNLKKYQDSLKTDREKELEEVNNFYNELIAGEMLFGDDYQKYVEARDKAVAEINEKYRLQEEKEAEEAAEKELERIQKQINRIRMENDTSNLKEPREQTYQSTYRQPVSTTILGVGPSWKNVYQSGSDVRGQYEAQLAYNNQYLALTRDRIETENEYLNKQLEIEGISADRRLEIERQLSENKMALSDAELDYDQANLEAFLKMQGARQQALTATLEVASNVTGGLANLMKAESEDESKGQKEREKAFKAYKGLAISQAIIDTYKSANEAYSAMAGIPYVGPYLAPVAAAAAIIAGIANVKRIMNETMSASTEQQAQIPTYQTPAIEYNRQLIGDKELDEMNQPIKCYVVESDITKVQNKVRVTEDNASF